jgi:hypothetical protein
MARPSGSTGVGLKHGKNIYTFHLEGCNKTKAKVVVFYNPGALDALSVVDPVGLPTVGAQEITIRGKAKPGDSVLHEKTRAKDPEFSRSMRMATGSEGQA